MKRGLVRKFWIGATLLIIVLTAFAAGRNLIHASDEEPGSAPREVALWFRPEELAGWSRELDRWYFEDD